MKYYLLGLLIFAATIVGYTWSTVTTEVEATTYQTMRLPCEGFVCGDMASVEELQPARKMYE